MQRKRIAILFLATAVTLLCTVVPKLEAKDPSKVGSIDLSKIFDEYQKTKESSQALEEEGKAKKAREEEMRQEIRKMKDELELLSEKARVNKQALVDQKVKELQDFIKEGSEELLDKKMSMMGEIMEDIEAVIREYGQSQNYDLIMNDTKMMPYHYRAVLYRNEGLDLTDEIIEILNSKYKKR